MTYAVPAITDINGTATASGSAGSLFIIDGSGFSNLSSGSPASGFSIDFRDSGTNAVVASATWAAGAWSDLYIKAIVPSSGLTAGTTYKVTVTTPGGTSNSVSFLILASVSFSPSTIVWSSTSALTTSIQGFPTVVAAVTSGSNTTNYIYTFGGNTAVTGTSNGVKNNVATVYSNLLTSTGTSAGSLANASWGTPNVLPAERGFSAAVFASGYNSKVTGNGYVYVLGGLDINGSPTSTVYYAAVNTDGTLGTWGTTTVLPQSLYAEGAVIFHGRVYVAGGSNSMTINGGTGIGTGTPVSTVYSAVINSNGALGNWSTLSALPVTLAHHQLVTSAGTLYVLGGSTTGIDPISSTQSGSSSGSVYYNVINLLDGTLTGQSWTTNSTSLIHPVEKNTVVAVGSYLLASGGLYSGASTGATEEQYAVINTDGSLGSFTGATGAHTITGTAGGYNFFNHSVAYFADATGTPHVVILGGQDVSSAILHWGVWYQH